MKLETEKNILWAGRTIIGTILVGIVGFLGNFFFMLWPDLKADVINMKSNDQMIKESLTEIKMDVKDLKKSQESILHNLAKKGR